MSHYLDQEAEKENSYVNQPNPLKRPKLDELDNLLTQTNIEDGESLFQKWVVNPMPEVVKRVFSSLTNQTGTRSNSTDPVSE